MIKVHDKIFERFISTKEINKIISRLANELEDLKNENPHFIVILNGSFMFASDLLKKISYDSKVSFIKLKSYEGTKSSGIVNEVIGLDESIKNQTVVVIEDIIDTGKTLNKIHQILTEKKPKKIEVVTMLLKPDIYDGRIGIKYIGKKIKNEFVLGYGLDYKELGRTLQEIFKLKKC